MLTYTGSSTTMTEAQLLAALDDLAQRWRVDPHLSAGGHLKVHHSWPGQTAPVPRLVESAWVTFRSGSRCLEADTTHHGVRGLTSAQSGNKRNELGLTRADAYVSVGRH